ncbi:hypothetical protein G3I19_30920 [Streptomyces sp. SID10853]|uniref:hypothetical protein n=1 Tax=Streptomyces sp. SID10853 TaxID=2706028 RepID=UPI0013C01348|nr:hypothetical protein [Streptomyces sp. SID10853]NDZ82867.1 hypothetical protein [Streptomyces sp. SID10853]
MLQRAGVRGAYMEAASMVGVAVCIGFWMRAKGCDQDERGNAERRALFVGLWPATLWLMGQSISEIERIERIERMARIERIGQPR